MAVKILSQASAGAENSGNVEEGEMGGEGGLRE